MIEIRDLGFNYKVDFTGLKEDYSKFFTTINNIPDTSKLKRQTGWKMPKCYLSQLEEQYTIKLIANEWDDIGEGLKLTPYCYQKEAIKFAIDNHKALLILPCGAGKTIILIGIYHELRKRHLTDKPVAIIVKASLKYQWVQEVIKFSDYKVKAIDTPAKTKSKFDNQFEDTDVFILNYETLKNDKVVAKLKEKNIETLLCD